MTSGAGRPDVNGSHHYEADRVPSDETICDVLREVVTAIDDTGYRALVMGGIGSATLARPRRTDDIDLFVHIDDVDDLLTHLGQHGFEVERTDARWLYKAFRQGVLTDLIFRSVGDIYVDVDMLQHATTGTYKGVPIRTVSPEDLLVIKALAASEHRAHHWHDALGIIARSDLDWSYLTERARRFGPRRVLSLLLYAESTDLAVPAPVVETLFDSVHAHQAGA